MLVLNKCFKGVATLLEAVCLWNCLPGLGADRNPSLVKTCYKNLTKEFLESKMVQHPQNPHRQQE